MGDLDDTSREGNPKEIPEIVETATRPTRDRKTFKFRSSEPIWTLTRPWKYSLMHVCSNEIG